MKMKWMRRSLTICAAALGLVLGLSSGVEAAGKMYWTDGVAKKIQRANLDGSGVEDLVTGLDNPRGIALDIASGKMYFPDDFVIRRANLDGSGVEVLPTGSGNPFGIALDVAGGKMYWTDILTDKIRRANLDGTGAVDLVTGLDNPFGIALDLAGGKMYWTAAGKIQRANLDGTGVQDLVTTGLSAFPHGIALDLAAGKMYWTDSSFNKIRRANLDGSGVEELVTGIVPTAIALDVAAGKMYWADAFLGIKRANLDGSGVEDLVTGLVQPNGIALDLLDHFLCYKARKSRLTPRFEPVDVFLADQFEDKNFQVRKPRFLCTPADKNDEGIGDTETHLVGYKIRRAPDEPRHVRQTNIKVENQFGTIFVDTRRPNRLLVPSAKSLIGPVDPPDPASIDHFKCYRVRTRRRICEEDPTVRCRRDADCDTGTCNLGFPKGITVTVDDQFDDTPKVFKVKRPRRLCTPVNKNGEGIIDPETHLMCYKVRRAKGEPRHQRVRGIRVNNQFGPLQLDTRKPRELCVPSTKTLP